LNAEPHSLVFGIPGTMLPGVILDCVFDDYFEALRRNNLGEVKEKRNLQANFSSGCHDVMSIVTRQYPGVAETLYRLDSRLYCQCSIPVGQIISLPRSVRTAR
jgi:hypothetical protein